MEGSSGNELKQGSSAVTTAYSHCFFSDAFDALLKCLGLERSKPQECSSTSEEEEEDGKACEAPVADPPTNPPARTPEDAPTGPGPRLLPRRPLPPVSRGRGGQINSSSS